MLFPTYDDQKRKDNLVEGPSDNKPALPPSSSQSPTNPKDYHDHKPMELDDI
jgi:hypothetical protein